MVENVDGLITTPRPVVIFQVKLVRYVLCVGIFLNNDGYRNNNAKKQRYYCLNEEK